jgi:hypothetical protein
MADDMKTMLDTLLIRQLIEQYARAVDSLDLARFEACFTAEVHADYSEITSAPAIDLPRAAFAAGILRSMSGFDSTHHLIANVAVDYDDETQDHAVCEAYVQAAHVMDDRLWLVGGVYTNHVVLTPDGWRIESLRLANRWQSGDTEIADLATARGRAGDGARRIT